MPQNIKDLMSAHLPISIVMFLILQTMGAVWWASEQLNDIHLGMAEVNLRLNAIDKLQTTFTSHEARLIVLEQNISTIKEDVSDIAVKERDHEKEPHYGNGQPHP